MANFKPIRAAAESAIARFPCGSMAFLFSRTVHLPADRLGLVRRSRYCSERFRLSLLQIYDLPTASTSTLLTARCGVRCRTAFIGRRCETL